MPDMRILPMKEEDLDEVESIEREAFCHGWSKAMYAAELNKNNSFHYVLVDPEEKVIGYYGFIKIFEDAEVTNVAVKREFRGKGLGNFLIEDMEKRALSLGIDNIFLEVRVSNAAAIGLYEKHRFSVINIRKKYYDGVEDALIMKRVLKEE
ncbi:MAG: ribosomal protein S18-alanine N-acetyltransferase [Clostridia bacterium]|jgi:ribosomal-protein-alanine N-acetyltransferase|nr:ribosomal protein S18-alanine N-acetyltransferase [Clostridia bacterium]